MSISMGEQGRFSFGERDITTYGVGNRSSMMSRARLHSALDQIGNPTKALLRLVTAPALASTHLRLQSRLATIVCTT
jgi:hypothetical protein